MKRSLIFVNALVLLFVFQSLWNVAASFCQHETDVYNLAQIQHFGHHQTLNCKQLPNRMAQQQNAEQRSETQKLSHVLLSRIAAIDDHHDHLPSFAHYIVEDVLLQSAPILSKHRTLASTFFLGSLYQSPDLSAQTPPPDYTPLWVG